MLKKAGINNFNLGRMYLLNRFVFNFHSKNKSNNDGLFFRLNKNNNNFFSFRK
jgi:hypothetical protein